MARTVQLACARCGHSEMYVVRSTEDEGAVGEILGASRDRGVSADDASAAIRLKRLELLPTSLPVGGIITPV